jgi:hypothetical protein
MNDICRNSLEEQVPQLDKEYKYVTCIGLYGAFTSALKYAEAMGRPIHIISGGSMITNFLKEAAIANLTDCRKVADSMIISHHAEDNEDKIRTMYGDTFMSFIRKGFEFATALIGYPEVSNGNWSLHGIVQRDPCRHTVRFTANEAIVYGAHYIPEGFTFDTFDSIKHPEDAICGMAAVAGWIVRNMWKDTATNMCMCSELSAGPR